VTNRPVRNDIAMTGEVTLRGRVLPIGGLKEKALGALRAGIKTLIIPKKNEKDLAEIPKHIKRKIKFIPVNQMEDVISNSIQGKFDKRKVRRTKKR
jgi:ATP-dependent Lon protease